MLAGHVVPIVDAPDHASPEELLAVHEALDRLAAVEARAAELVKLRYFAGFTNKEAAEILGVSPRTADNLWAYGRAWPAVEMRSLASSAKLAVAP